ncbi:hypothetical protein MHU86_20960 [Fragilaria crotonensis]|nr:hypothetical protein MHU86_20960 [Fragilaria crotonensis]
MRLSSPLALLAVLVSTESQTLGTPPTTATDVPSITPSNVAPEETSRWFDPSIRPAAYHCIPDRLLGLNCGVRKSVTKRGIPSCCVCVVWKNRQNAFERP